MAKGSCLLLCACCMLIGAGPGTRPDVPSTAPSAAPEFSGRLRRYKASAVNSRSEMDDLTMAAKTASFPAKDDVALMQKDLGAGAEMWESAAARLAAGDEEGAKEIAIQAEKSDRHRRIWAERIETRIKAIQSAPTEAMFDELMRDRPRSDYPAIARLIAARKNASDALLALADAIVPDGDETIRDQAADKAFLMDIEAHVADMQFHWMVEDGWTHYDPAITSPELQAINQHIADLRKQRIDDYRAQRLLDRKIQQEEEIARKLGAQKRDLYNKMLYPATSSSEK